MSQLPRANTPRVNHLFVFSIHRGFMKYVWKIIVRHSPDGFDARRGYAWAGSMGEALEMADHPNAIAIPQTHKPWPGGPGETFFWN